MYTELQIGNETYKLRLNTRTSIQLEKNLGRNPISMLIDMADGNVLPKRTDIVLMLQAMLQVYHHGYNLDKTMDLYDDFLASGKNDFDMIPVFTEVFQTAGYIGKPDENADGEDAKN
jgi:hypothetical protein